MKKIKLSFLLCFVVLFSTHLNAQDRDAKLQGTVLNNKGETLHMATVVLKGTSQGTSTDSYGNYSLNVASGNYTIEVAMLGYVASTSSVRLKSGLTTKDFILQPKDQELDEVVLIGEQNKLANKKTDYVARMPLKNIENPQVYSVVNKELLVEQVAIDITSAFQNSPGTTPVVYPSGGLGVTFRGFSTGVNARNGMETVSGRSSLDIANIERIEVLKGPSGTLFGASVSSFGGVVNLVTKKPNETKKTEISYTGGSFGLNRITADINTPLSKDNKVLFRLNTAINKQKSFLDYGFNNTYLIAPSLVLGNSPGNTTIMTNKTRPKVLFFDVNETLLDLTDMKQEISLALNGRDDLLSLWFTTMLQYSLVTTASGQYEHFGNIGAAALQMVAANNGIEISEEDARKTVVNSLRGLPAHPDVKEALAQLKNDGYTLVSFTNSSNEGVKKQFESAGLLDFFDDRLSVEDIGKFKPFSDTYAWAARKMNVKPAECMLVAAHGWDVAGALWAGWRAAFISRPGQQLFL